MNKTLYRKYKPNNFENIIGQFYIKKILLNSLKNNMISHAYIFSGPRGVGKTSIARIFAKSINCLDKQNGDACSICINCKLFDSSECMDVIELDAASNNGVSEIRNLIESTKFMPSMFQKKIYIIDEAHMLTNNSWNALLKTLEDPPSNVIFIFATTEVNKVPLTILSRCQRFDFEKISNDNLKNVINKIVNLESIKINNDAISEIVSISDGSVRDCLSMLNQIINYSNDEITSNDIWEIFGLININQRIELIKLVIKKDIISISNLIKQYELKGVNFYKLIYHLIEILLDKLFFLKSNSFNNLKILNKNNINDFHILEDDLLKIIEILQNGIIQIKNNIDDRLFFELILLSCITYLNDNITIEEKEENMNDNNYGNDKLIKNEFDNSIDNKVEEISPKIISNIDIEEFHGKNVKFDDVVISRKFESKPIEKKNILENFNNKPCYEVKEVNYEPPKDNNFLKNDNFIPNENDSSLYRSSTKNNLSSNFKNNISQNEEDFLLAELDRNLSKSFFEIAFNNDNEIKIKLNKIFDTFKNSPPKTPQDGYIIDASKILIASKNGIVFMFDHELSALNLNLVVDNEDFLIYIKNNFGSLYKVIGVTREQAKEFSNSVKKLKFENKSYPDVNLERLKLKIKKNASTREIAQEIFGEELNK